MEIFYSIDHYKNRNLNMDKIGKANRNVKLVLTIWRMKESMRRLIKFLSGGGHCNEKMARIGGTTRAASLPRTSTPGTSLT